VLNALDAARTWGVRRFAVASSIGVYIGRTETRWHEELAPPAAELPHLIVAFKKAVEPLTKHDLQGSGVQPVVLPTCAAYSAAPRSLTSPPSSRTARPLRFPSGSASTAIESSSSPVRARAKHATCATQVSARSQYSSGRGSQERGPDING
jgi:hypothetical protein